MHDNRLDLRVINIANLTRQTTLIRSPMTKSKAIKTNKDAIVDYITRLQTIN